MTPLERITSDWIQYKKDIILIACNLCCCGTDGVPELLEEVLRWCDQRAAAPIEIKDEIEKRGCYRSVEWELAAKVLDSCGLIEHGTGIGWPWTTQEGKEVLQFIDNWKSPEDEN